jgi:hypothetical protein
VLLVFWFALLALVFVAVTLLIVLPFCGALAAIWAGWMRGGRAGEMIASMTVGCLAGLAVAIALLVLGATYILS